jgi:hypothetical protein
MKIIYVSRVGGNSYLVDSSQVVKGNPPKFKAYDYYSKEVVLIDCDKAIYDRDAEMHELKFLEIDTDEMPRESNAVNPSAETYGRSEPVRSVPSITSESRRIAVDEVGLTRQQRTQYQQIQPLSPPLEVAPLVE